MRKIARCAVVAQHNELALVLPTRVEADAVETAGVQVWTLTVAWGPRSPSPFPSSFPRVELQHGVSLPVPQLACVCHRLRPPLCLLGGGPHVHARKPTVLAGGNVHHYKYSRKPETLKQVPFNPRRACLPLQEVHFSFLLQNYEGFGFMET